MHNIRLTYEKPSIVLKNWWKCSFIHCYICKQYNFNYEIIRSDPFLLSNKRYRSIWNMSSCRLWRHKLYCVIQSNCTRQHGHDNDFVYANNIAMIMEPPGVLHTALFRQRMSAFAIQTPASPNIHVFATYIANRYASVASQHGYDHTTEEFCVKGCEEIVLLVQLTIV